MQLSHLAARFPAAILAYIHCGEMSVSVCACATMDALMSPPPPATAALFELFLTFFS